MHGPSPRPTRHQRGAMAIAMMLMLLGLISILGIVEVGYLYWAHRDAQKVADLAALSGAQQLSSCTIGNDDNAAARSNATTDNHFKGSLTIACGYWAPSITGDQHFSATVDATHPRNAVRVKVSMPLTPFFGFAHFSGVEATAIAANRGDPIAAFSVGSRLLGLSNTGPLNQLLNSVLGTSLGLKLLSYDGIANGNLSLLGLKDALHIDAGTVTGVLGTQVSLGDFLDAAVDVLQQNGSLANVDVTSAKTQIANIPVDLRNVEIELGDILNVQANTEDPGKALDVNVNAQDLLSAAIQAADSKHAVALEVPNLDLLGLANVNLKLAIVEPPKIGVGRAGYNPDGTPITVAHTAEVRLLLDLHLLSLGKDPKESGASSPINIILPSGSAMHIPLNLELVPADAWLDSIQCHIPKPNTATMDDWIKVKAQPGAADVILGTLPSTAYDDTSTRWSDMLEKSINDKTIYGVNGDDLINLNIPLILTSIDIAIQAYAHAPVMRTEDTHKFVVSDTPPISTQDGTTWTTQTGDTILTSILSAITDPTLLNIRPDPQQHGILGGLLSTLLADLAKITTSLTGILKPILNPIFGQLDKTLISPLLDNVLGIDIGAADVHLLDVNCNTGVQLVY